MAGNGQITAGIPDTAGAGDKCVPDQWVQSKIAERAGKRHDLVDHPEVMDSALAAELSVCDKKQGAADDLPALYDPDEGIKRAVLRVKGDGDIAAEVQVIHFTKGAQAAASGMADHLEPFAARLAV